MAAAVETPLALFQEPIKPVFLNTIEAAERPLGLVPTVLDTVDVVSALAHKHLAMVHTAMMELAHIQHIVGPETIRIDDAVRRHVFADEGDQRRGVGIRNDGRVHVAACAATSPAFTHTTKLAFIRFDFSR